MVVNPFTLTLLHSEWLKLLRVLAVLSAIGLKCGGEPIYLNPIALRMAKTVGFWLL